MLWPGALRLAPDVGSNKGILTGDGTYFYQGYMTDGRRMTMIFNPDGTLILLIQYLNS